MTDQPEPSADAGAVAELETTGEVLLDVTPAAMKMVLEIRNQEDEPENTALRVEVAGVAGAEHAITEQRLGAFRLADIAERGRPAVGPRPAGCRPKADLAVDNLHLNVGEREPSSGTYWVVE